MEGQEEKEGYKLTEVGVIPEDWEVEQLGDKTTKIGSGITPLGGSKVYKLEGRPFLRSQNVEWGYLSLEDIAYIDEETHAIFPNTEIKNQDVLLNITGASIGRTAIADERVINGNVNQHVCIIRTRKKELNPIFLNLFLLSKQGQKQIDSSQAGGNREGVNFGQIRLFKIPVPPLPEQEKIAQVLSDVDSAIAHLDKLINKKRNLKQGTMQQLLTGKKRLSGFGHQSKGYKNTQLGVISEDWEVFTLQALFNLKNGVNADKKQYGKGIKFINVLEIIQNSSLFYKDIPGFISLDLQTIKNNLVQKGDILFNRTSETQEEIGLTSVYLDDKEVVFGGFVIRARPINNLINCYFSKYAFSSVIVRNQIIKKGQGAVRANIGQSDLKEVYISLPPLPEQKAIAQTLTDMDAEIEALEKKRDKYKAIKQGMMQELLTGKTRLK